MFAVRITREFSVIKPFFDKVISVHPQSVLVVYQHDADEEVSRTHIHALMENVNPSTDTLKRWIKAECGLTDISRYDWSFKSLEDRKFITYMSKGTLQPVLVHNIAYEEVTALASEWKEMRKSVDKREDVTAYAMAEELAQWIDMDTRSVEYDPVQRKWVKVSGDSVTEYDIVLQCIKIHNKYRKGYCDFSLVRVVQTAYGICSQERWRDRLVGKVLEKLSPFKT